MNIKNIIREVKNRLFELAKDYEKCKAKKKFKKDFNEIYEVEENKDWVFKMPERYYTKRQDIRYKNFLKTINQINQKIVRKNKKCEDYMMKY